jgi:hypothetical protein
MSYMSNTQEACFFYKNPEYTLYYPHTNAGAQQAYKDARLHNIALGSLTCDLPANFSIANMDSNSFGTSYDVIAEIDWDLMKLFSGHDSEAKRLAIQYEKVSKFGVDVYNQGVVKNKQELDRAI